VTLSKFRIRDFRCINGVELSAHPDFNLIVGGNAAGKTSLLEAIYYLGRGRSFRSGTNVELIRGGAQAFTLYAEVAGVKPNSQISRLGTEVSRGTKLLRMDGETAVSSNLIAALPVQAIDPEIHEIIQGGPEQRRRFLDWGVFHVEHRYIDTWRVYKTTLKQRNAALKSGAPSAAVTAWNEQLVNAGNNLDLYRKSFISSFRSQLSSILVDMFPFEIKIGYLPGWRDGIDYATALAESLPRDRILGATQVGPHRADMQLKIEGRSAKHRLSRGQQKLLGCALVIAQTHFVAAALDRQIVLLVDDPAAELDPEHQERLFSLLQTVPAQLFVTSLDPRGMSSEKPGKTFAIEAGNLTALV
jgi:DNA replication and repair protein RecF